jgi:hypothetical protein
MAPLLPVFDEPVLNTSRPLPPPVPPFALDTMIAPLEVPVPSPL